MFLRNKFLTTVLGLSALLLSNNAQAQSTDSTWAMRPPIVVPQVKDSTKTQPRSYRIMCRSTLPAGNSPLYVVDGILISEQEFKLTNPNDIDKIEILKGATATALYGSRAVNGVILISLKHPQAKRLHQPIEKKSRLD